jgi:hypothetical protein
VNHRSDSKPIAFCQHKQCEVAQSVAMHDFPGPKWTGYWFLAQLRSFGFSALRFPRLPRVTSRVSSHSIDFPNSRLIFSRICAPFPSPPCSIRERCPLAHANPRRELRLRYVEHSFGAAKLKLLGAIVLLRSMAQGFQGDLLRPGLECRETRALADRMLPDPGCRAAPN